MTDDICNAFHMIKRVVPVYIHHSRFTVKSTWHHGGLSSFNFRWMKWIEKRIIPSNVSKVAWANHKKII